MLGGGLASLVWPQEETQERASGKQSWLGRQEPQLVTQGHEGTYLLFRRHRRTLSSSHVGFFFSCSLLDSPVLCKMGISAILPIGGIRIF